MQFTIKVTQNGGYILKLDKKEYAFETWEKLTTFVMTLPKIEKKAS